MVAVCWLRLNNKFLRITIIIVSKQDGEDEEERSPHCVAGPQIKVKDTDCDNRHGIFYT